MKLENVKNIEKIISEYGIYWYINGEGFVCYKQWANAEVDYQHLKIGNIFDSKEAANDIVERLKVPHLLLDCNDLCGLYGDMDECISLVLKNQFDNKMKAIIHPNLKTFRDEG